MKYKILVVSIYFLTSVSACFGQRSTGINNINPNPKAALHVEASGPTQGIIIPRLTSLQGANPHLLSPTDEGLMFYNSDKDSLFY